MSKFQQGEVLLIQSASGFAVNLPGPGVFGTIWLSTIEAKTVHDEGAKLSMADSNGRLVAVDLFSGAGGLSEGLLAAGINVAVAVESHPHPALTHAFNHPETTVLCGDVRELSIECVKAQVESRVGNADVDVVVGGPPCQGFSPAGKQDKDDPRNELFREFVRFVECLQPRIFLFENVPGFAKLYESQAIHKLLDAFWEIGYRIHGIDNDSEYYPEQVPILNAAWYGVPQRRKRLVLVGFRESDVAESFTWPSPTHGEDLISIEGFATTSQMKRKAVWNVEDAIDDLAFLSAGFECHVYQEQALTEYQLQRRANSSILFNHLATKHRKDTVNLFRRLAPGATIRSLDECYRTGKQRMRRLTRSENSSAVLALPDDYVHYQRHRIPTVREMARLQSFDDDFVFLGKRTTSDLNRRVDVPQYTQVGNAVPPLLARALGRSIVRSVGGRAKDIRSRKERRQRLGWLRGSSSYHGYTLASEAEGNISLYDMDGNELRLPVSDDEVLVGSIERQVKWSSRRNNRRNQRSNANGR